MLKQTKPYGCGLYAVANALNIPEFITDERLEESEEYGNTLGQLSKWLQEDEMNYCIDALFYDHIGDRLPETALEYRPNSSNFLPVLLNVQFSEEGKRHLVGGLIDVFGTLILMDSLSDDIEVTTLAEANEKYYRTFGLFIFMDADTGDYILLG